jgi:hypothetical protein
LMILLAGGRTRPKARARLSQSSDWASNDTAN